MTSTGELIDRSPVHRLVSLGAVIVLTFIAGFILRLPVPTTARGWIPVVLVSAVGLLLWAFVLPLIVRPLPVRLLLLAVVAAGTGWFLLEPLFADDMVDEALPMTAPARGGGDPSPAPTTSRETERSPATGSPPQPRPQATERPAVPVRVASGMLAGINHRAAGTVGLYTLTDGTPLVRIEESDMENGPDLFVYLVPEPDQRDDRGAVNLGRLKGNIGSSNYPVPLDVDVREYATVLIWCRAFSTPFANATLTPL